MKILIAEDDFGCRRVMKMFLGPYGDCDIAVDGVEAVKAFRMALEEGQRYDLICLDIMMPKMDGQTTLKEIRAVEEERGIHGLDGVKVIMTTGLGDKKNILEAFNSQCEAYLVKPITREDMSEKLRYLGLLQGPEHKGL